VRDDARSSDLIQRRGRATSAYDEKEVDYEIEFAYVQTNP
jgi:hypothetical protein